MSGSKSAVIDVVPISNRGHPAERCARSVTSRMARRVLPTPPVPVSVSSRVVLSSLRRSATSCSRPMKLLSAACITARGDTGTDGARSAETRDGRAAARNAALSFSVNWSARDKHWIVAGCGRLRAPRSRSEMPCALSPARSANASWLSPDASRNRRSTSPKLAGALVATGVIATSQDQPVISVQARCNEHNSRGAAIAGGVRELVRRVRVAGCGPAWQATRRAE